MPNPEDEDATNFASYYADARVIDPAEEAVLNEEREAQFVLRLLAQLDAREALILRLRHGIPEEVASAIQDGAPIEEMTLREISEKLGITRERVRQIEAKALEKLREIVHA